MIKVNSIVAKIMGFKKNSNMIANICKILEIPYKIDKRGRKTYILIDEFDVTLLVDFLLLTKRQRYEYTCLKKYGVKNISQIKEIKLKKERTTLNHYGVKNPFESKEIKEKIKQTNLKNLGVEYPMQSSKVKEKAKQYWLENFGVINNSCLPEQKELRRQKMILLNSLGITRPKRYFFDNLYFDSSWEFIYYYYQKYYLGKNIQRGKTFHYIKDGKNCSYYCDFLVEDENVEIKGDQFIKNGYLYNPYTKEILIEKTNCLKENNVKIVSEKEIKEILTKMKKGV